MYVSTVRDCYEAWILYNFHSLCLLYVGGPGEIETRAQGKVVEPSYVLMTCCFPPLQVDGKLLRQCKQATLQFVLAKPFLAATVFVLESYDDYSEGDFSPTKGYVYVVFVMNICYAVALYGLIIFYLAAQDLLRPYNPVVKVVLIKGVIFFTFWQGFLLSLLTSCGAIETSEEALEIQNLLICVEMFVASLCTLAAFPHKQYIVHDSKSLNVTGMGGKISHAISFTDVLSDTFHQFAPAYHDYTLYAAGEEGGKSGKNGAKGNGKKKPYRMKTYVFKDLESVQESGPPGERTSRRERARGGLGSDDDAGRSWEAEGGLHFAQGLHRGQRAADVRCGAAAGGGGGGGRGGRRCGGARDRSLQHHSGGGGGERGGGGEGRLGGLGGRVTEEERWID